MGIGFDALTKSETMAVADLMRRQYELIASRLPTTYVSRNTKAAAERWQDGLHELIASDPKRAQRTEFETATGFTLIELSIVLVIIGLIVGGVLVGQSLIKAAEVRATITQIEKFNTAVNVFYGKYQALPGDINANSAAQIGLTTRSGTQGYGDGNGLLEDGQATTGIPMGLGQGGGEIELFWIDLTTANGLNLNLIDGSFSTTPIAGNTPAVYNAALPQAKLGGGNYFYVYSYQAANYFGLSIPTDLNGNKGSYCALPGLTVKQAYDIDSKIDDGLPQTGRVLAKHVIFDYLSQTAPAWAHGPSGAYGGCGDNRAVG